MCVIEVRKSICVLGGGGGFSGIKGRGGATNVVEAHTTYTTIL